MGRSHWGVCLVTPGAVSFAHTPLCSCGKIQLSYFCFLFVALCCRVREHGEMALESARAYFEYGNVLLLKEEDAPTDNLLGDAAQKANIDAVVRWCFHWLLSVYTLKQNVFNFMMTVLCC
jgi:hypothetical protein